MLGFAILLGALVTLMLVIILWPKKTDGPTPLDAEKDLPPQSEFNPDWVRILGEQVPLYDKLPKRLQQRLQRRIIHFLNTKQFVGCSSLTITDDIRVSVAAQACILLLNRDETPFPYCDTIYMYPSTYVAKTLNQEGHFEVEGQSVRAGESWMRGPVVLSWDHTRYGAEDIRDGKNVVLHEFAHQLDQADGSSDGTPWLNEYSHYATWGRVMVEHYEALQKKALKGKRHLMDHYGATNPAEFFAVATETFFEKGRHMKRKHPKLYGVLKTYYRLDPAAWGKRSPSISKN